MAPGPDPYAAMTAFNRFGLGAKPGDLALAASDPRGFLLEEIRAQGAGLIPAEGLSSTPEALQKFFAEQQQLRVARETAAAMAAPLVMASANASQMDAKMGPPWTRNRWTPSPRRPNPNRWSRRSSKDCFAPRRWRVLARNSRQGPASSSGWSPSGRIISRCRSPRARVLRATAGAFEREAIRPHVLGKFSDLLIAVESHPAMIFYLDNQRSIGPGSNAGRFDGKGLNENLAREILELHTLGVDGGYAQPDVTALARIITGWSFAEAGSETGEPGAFLFKANWHEPGVHNLLGKNYPQAGRAQGEAALRDLARHPSTARHIATKLARHFVADAPPPDLVDALAKAFRDSDGDLAVVTAALVTHDRAWSAPPTKIRDPNEFVIAAMRATAFTPNDPGQILGVMNSLGMPLWQPAGPNGYADTTAVWASPEQMKLRLDVSWQMAQRARDYGAPLGVLDTVCGLAASRETRDALLHAESRPQALALLFMSPEFQRR